MTEYDLSCAAWRKSTRSGQSGNCVEVAVVPAWRKSSRSGQSGSCVEVAVVPAWRKSARSGQSGECVEVTAPKDTEGKHHVIAVRDSKDPGGPKLFFTRGQWQRLVDRVKAGRLDLA
jgi:hypothetical protein